MTIDLGSFGFLCFCFGVAVGVIITALVKG